MLVVMLYDTRVVLRLCGEIVHTQYFGPNGHLLFDFSLGVPCVGCFGQLLLALASFVLEIITASLEISEGSEIARELSSLWFADFCML